MEDGTDSVGEFKRMTTKQLCFIDCEVDKLLERFDVAFVLFFKEALN